jgi:hypothetical protein
LSTNDTDDGINSTLTLRDSEVVGYGSEVGGGTPNIIPLYIVHRNARAVVVDLDLGADDIVSSRWAVKGTVRNINYPTSIPECRSTGKRDCIKGASCSQGNRASSSNSTAISNPCTDTRGTRRAGRASSTGRTGLAELPGVDEPLYFPKAPVGVLVHLRGLGDEQRLISGGVVKGHY